MRDRLDQRSGNLQRMWDLTGVCVCVCAILPESRWWAKVRTGRICLEQEGRPLVGGGGAGLGLETWAKGGASLRKSTQ